MMFGARSRLGQMIGNVPLWRTPGIVPEPVVDDEMAVPARSPRRGVFGRLAQGAAEFTNPANPLAQLGAALLAADDNPIGQALMQVQGANLQAQQYQRMLERQKAMDERQARRDAMDEEYTRKRMEAMDAPKDDRTALMQNFEWFNSLPPEQQAMARQMLPNYQYTPDGITAAAQRMGAVTGARNAATPQRTGMQVRERPAMMEGQTATNPQTGQKIVWSKGRWRPL